MQAEPLYEPGNLPTHHWVQGIDTADPELLAIIEVAKELDYKPRCFRVGENIYSISDRVWKEISR